MKIAITSKGTDLKAEVDPRFGRAPYLIVVDTETMEFEAVDNSSNVNAFKGAGIQAATLVADKKAEVLLTGYCGPNAFKTVQAANIQVVNDVSGKVDEAVRDFLDGKMQYSSAPNTDGHW